MSPTIVDIPKHRPCPDANTHKNIVSLNGTIMYHGRTDTHVGNVQVKGNIVATASVSGTLQRDISRLYNDRETADFELILEDTASQRDFEGLQSPSNQSEPSESQSGSESAVVGGTVPSRTKPVSRSDDVDDSPSPQMTHTYHLHYLIVAQHSPVLKRRLDQLFAQSHVQSTNTVTASNAASNTQQHRPQLHLTRILHEETTNLEHKLDFLPSNWIDMIRVQHLKAILRYMYTGTMRIPKPGQEIPLYALARVLQMDGIKDALLAYMGTFFTSQDACNILETTLSHKHYKLFEMCSHLVEADSNHVFQSALPNIYSESVPPPDKAQFMQWTPQMLQHFFVSGSLNDFELFQIAKTYCLHNAQAYNMEPRDMFQLYFDPHIRYPQINVESLAKHVLPLAWSKQQYINEALRFHAVSDSNHAKLEKQSIKCQPRPVTFGKCNIQFETSSQGLQRLGVEPYTAHGRGYTFETIFTNATWDKPGRYYVEFELTMSTDPSNVFFGVTSNPSRRTAGYAAQYSNGFQLYAYNSTFYASGQSTTYCQGPITSGDRVGVYLKANPNHCGDLYFFLNGKCLGLASAHVPLPTTPVVSPYSSVDTIKIVKNAQRPPSSLLTKQKC